MLFIIFTLAYKLYTDAYRLFSIIFIIGLSLFSAMLGWALHVEKKEDERKNKYKD